MGHALLRISKQALEGAILLPEGYEIVSMQYVVQTKTLECTVASDKIDWQQNTYPLPDVHLVHTVDFQPLPDGTINSEYKKITGSIKPALPLGTEWSFTK